MGSANLVPVGYNGKKSSFIGDSEYLMWYNISFIWENTLCCSPQIVVSQYVSYHDDSSLKHFQPIHLLCCANVSFHEVGLLAETMNQCRSKIPQGKTLLFSSQVSSVILVTVQPHKELCEFSCAWRWCEGTHTSSWDRDEHGELLALPIWLHKTGNVKVVWVLVKVSYQPAACQMPSTNISDQDLPQFLGGEFVFKLPS